MSFGSDDSDHSRERGAAGEASARRWDYPGDSRGSSERLPGLSVHSWGYLGSVRCSLWDHPSKRKLC